jgi:hypothetical protein
MRYVHLFVESIFHIGPVSIEIINIVNSTTPPKNDGGKIERVLIIIPSNTGV